MNWPISCPVCGKEYDSMDSYGDSRAMVRVHLWREHGLTEDIPELGHPRA